MPTETRHEPAFMARYKQDVLDHVHELLASGSVDEGNGAVMDAYIDGMLEDHIARMTKAHKAEVGELMAELAASELRLKQAQAREAEEKAVLEGLTTQLREAQDRLVGRVDSERSAS